MGGNRRYDMLGHDVSCMQDAWKRRPQPIGLTEHQLTATGRRIDANQPINVSAWIPVRVTYDDPQLVDGRAIAWTDQAVLVEWTSPETQQLVRTWVWASGVTRRSHK